MNIDNELKKYCKLKLEGDTTNITSINGALVKSIEDIAKSQKKSTLGVMQMKSELENKYKQNILNLEASIEASRKDINSYKNNEELFVEKIIKVVDEIYKLKDYAVKSGNEKLAKTIMSNIKVIKKEIGELGIIIKDSLGEEFNVDYHEGVAVVNDNNKRDNEIVEEVKVCIIYNNDVVRAAQVIINKVGE